MEITNKQMQEYFPSDWPEKFVLDISQEHIDNSNPTLGAELGHPFAHAIYQEEWYNPSEFPIEVRDDGIYSIAGLSVKVYDVENFDELEKFNRKLYYEKDVSPARFFFKKTF